MSSKKNFSVILALLILIAPNSESSFLTNQDDAIEHNETILVEKWERFQKNTQNTVSGLIKQALPYLLRASNEFELSEECTFALTKLIFSVGKLQLWSLKMLDAFAKPMSGILDGTLSSVGDYDQCLEIEVNPDSADGFKGQYCSITIRPPLPPKTHFYRLYEELKGLRNFTAKNPLMKLFKTDASIFYTLGLRFGACLPSKCSQEDVQNIVQSVTKSMDFNAKVTNCHTREVNEIAKDQLAVICFISIMAALVLLSTALHVFMYKAKEDINETRSLTWQLVRSFSISYNLPRLLDTKVSSENASLQFLHGLKFISITWVVLGHTHFYTNFQSLHRNSNSREYGKSVPFQTVVNAALSVSTFFFISGVLVSNISVKMVNKYGLVAFNIPIFIAKRIWRLVPSALLVVGLFILLPLIGDGPYWHELMDEMVSDCRTKWWGIALNINNFFPPTRMCIQSSWYISCEFQLYLCSLFFLWLLFKKKHYGFLMAFFMIAVSVIVPGLITYFLALPPNFLIVNPDVEDREIMQRYIYFQAYHHSASTALGLLLGYYLATSTGKIKIPKVARCIGWVLAFGLGALVTFITALWHRSDYVYSIPESIAYASLFRLAFALGIAWLSLMCATGHGGIINSILSWRAFLPLSRLVYLIYLLNFLVIWFTSLSYRSTVDIRHENTIIFWLGFISMSMILAFVAKLFFESPLQELERVVLWRFVGSKAKAKDLQFNNNKIDLESNGRNSINSKLKSSRKMVLRNFNEMSSRNGNTKL